jgi:hypothetical protein
MQWKVIREAGGDMATLRLGVPSSADFQELTLPIRDWLQIAESITDLNRPEPPSSWFAGGSDDH